MKKTRIAALLLALVLCLGLLPMAALAEEAETPGPFTITFDADGGKFPDGKTTWTTATKWLGAGNNITENPPYPERSGYIFDGWDVKSENSIGNVDFTADATVKAKWRLNSNLSFPLDANGGTVSPDHFNVDEDFHIIGRLPTPTRPGYTFEGWYIDGKPVDESKPLTSTAPFPVAQWKRASVSKISPAVAVSPAKIDAGAEKAEITLSCATSGAALDWRPLERALYSDGKPADAEAAVKSLISGNFTGAGLRLTGVRYEKEFQNVDDRAYPSEFYPDGVYPVQALVLTLEGKAISGKLTLELAPSVFVSVAYKDEDITLDASSAEMFHSAKAVVTVGGGAASKDGPFTVKFDLNCKDPKQDEIPKEKTVAKGDTVGLPDGSKLTPPAANYEFYAWCIEGKDGKLYPWKQSNPVTEDMTLYAGWVKKGTVVKDGQAIDSKPAEPEKPAETQKPAQTPAPKFTDVAATSPFAAAISWAVEQKITNGKTATTFGPGDPCTRAQIVTFLWRASGSPEPKSMEAEYADVTKTDAYYYKAVQWAAEMGMEESGTFAPHDTCSRVTAVYFIWTAFGSPKAAAKASFEDVREPERGQWYWPDLPDAVDWAVEKGVTTGKTATTFGPGDPCTRGQIVTFLYRAYVK